MPANTRWRCEVKAKGSQPLPFSFLFVYLFLFYYIFVSYSLSAAGVDPLLLRGYLISKDNIFLEGVVR